MKYIQNDPRTQQALNHWAGSNGCIMATYFFWSAGTLLQKSLEGLLRSILFDIFVSNPSLIQLSLPERSKTLETSTLPSGRFTGFATVDGKVTDLNTWTQTQLLRALGNLSTTPSINQKFCLFIDGLDEYYGEHSTLIQILEEISIGHNFKLCVSSRPWNLFEDALGSDATRKLYIHELTKNDIRNYTVQTLRENPRWREEASKDPRYNLLTEKIAERAQGVFLWVVLVVRSIKEGVINRDSIKLLQHRLRDLPSDLSEFFRHILVSIPPIYHRQTALYFQVTLQARSSLPVLLYSFLDDCLESSEAIPQTCQGSTAMSEADIELRYDMMVRRLNARCKGLLECVKPSQDTMGPKTSGRIDVFETSVSFLHRTVRDFLAVDEFRGTSRLPQSQTALFRYR
ncbi:hypothetical protein QBC35DRAFT_518841 [Podospora australis]|uniref:NACHT domain-containing protein n=1 Tax=Podospora australis TaxID=1536484 RepID=A0AAN6WJ80_9PEZI|nr:hypothetical protein QBC35DRAFT_518841 [Podospora australis]